MLIFAVDDIFHSAVDVAKNPLDSFVCFGGCLSLELYL